MRIHVKYEASKPKDLKLTTQQTTSDKDKINMSVSGNLLKKIRVGRSKKYFILFFHLIMKWCKMQKFGPYKHIVTLKIDNSSYYA